MNKTYFRIFFTSFKIYKPKLKIITKYFFEIFFSKKVTFSLTDTDILSNRKEKQFFSVECFCQQSNLNPLMSIVRNKELSVFSEIFFLTKPCK